MVRFIFACMVIVALSVLALPLTGIYTGIDAQRQVTVASVDTQETDTADEDVFALDETAAPSADDLNAIATAAGGTEATAATTTDTFSGGFSGTAPAALAPDAPAADIAPETPAAN